MTNERQGVLNPIGVNVLRTFPDAGTVIFGARTLVTANTALQQWRYVAVRRMALFIEQTLMNNLGWAIFEPNDQPLWDALRTSVSEFMLSLFRQAAFQGSTPSQAFKVLCDSTTTTQQDIDNGVVNILVAFRPLKPAEFVVIKIAQLAGQTP
jgi:phage tail sheath protein FI